MRRVRPGLRLGSKKWGSEGSQPADAENGPSCVAPLGGRRCFAWRHLGRWARLVRDGDRPRGIDRGAASRCCVREKGASSSSPASINRSIWRIFCAPRGARRERTAGPTVASCSATGQSTPSAMPARRLSGCGNRAFTACGSSPLGITCAAVSSNSSERCPRSKSSRIRSYPTRSGTNIGGRGAKPRRCW